MTEGHVPDLDMVNAGADRLDDTRLGPSPR
jgi:hypothetical protein